MGSTFDQEFDQFEDLVEEAKERFPGFQLSERISDTVQSIIGDVQHEDENEKQAIFRLRGVGRMLYQSQRAFVRNSPKFFDGALRKFQLDADLAKRVMNTIGQIEDFCEKSQRDFDLEQAGNLYRSAQKALEKSQVEQRNRRVSNQVKRLAAMSERNARNWRAVSDRAV